MYNIHSHYETIFTNLKNIVTHRRVLYLSPYGSTQPENIEIIADAVAKFGAVVPEGPLYIFYDQEPIYGEFNYKLFDHIKNRFQPPFILVTTEQDSEPLDAVKEKYGWPVAYNFHHVFATHDWYRGQRFNADFVNPDRRVLKKKYISFNRLTKGHRVYRSILISELYKRHILYQGYVSYWPDEFPEELREAARLDRITMDLANDTIDTLHSIDLATLSIDYANTEIPNSSFVLNAVKETQESFCFLVTETCFWEKKSHLTEKIFKPIVHRMPFVLAGPAHNLKYLRSYGFKTFDQWIDESYDDIEDPVLRLQAIVDTMEKICQRSLSELETMLQEMQPILEHNYNLFYSNEFLDHCWGELLGNLKSAYQEVIAPK